MSSGEPTRHALVISGSEPTPVELFVGRSCKRDDLGTTHEEADVIMVYQVLRIAEDAVDIKATVTIIKP